MPAAREITVRPVFSFYGQRGCRQAGKTEKTEKTERFREPVLRRQAEPEGTLTSQSTCMKLFPQSLDKSEKHAEIPPCGLFFVGKGKALVL
jgi:hypothetical protein